jgi:hypothetical protein
MAAEGQSMQNDSNVILEMSVTSVTYGLQPNIKKLLWMTDKQRKDGVFGKKKKWKGRYEWGV